MFKSLETLELSSSQLWLGQIPIITPVISPPQFFVALIAGLVLAFAIQLLLTNLSVAAGISYLGNQSDSDSHGDSSGSLGGTIKKIGTAVGLWTLITVTIALFVACLLAVKLSLITSAGLGAILGLVIWAAYFSLLVWVSSTTVGSLIGSVVNTATSGFQAIVGTATAAFAGKAVNDRVVATAEAAASAVRRELTIDVDPGRIRDTIEDYLDNLRPAGLDLGRIRSEFENLLNDPELKSLAGSEGLRNIDRQKFVDLISSRTDFSKRDVERLADQLEGAWKRVVGQQPQRDPVAELKTYLESASPESLRSSELSDKLDQLVKEVRMQRMAVQGQTEQTPGIVQQAMQLGMSTLMGSVLGRADISDLDANTILEKLKSYLQQLTDQTKQITSQVSEQSPSLPFNTIRTDVENYLLNSYTWHLNRETINREFRETIYDPDADPGTVRRQLQGVDREYFSDLLRQRGDLTPAKVTEIADQLEAIRLEILAVVQIEEAKEETQDLRTRTENYLRSTSSDLSPEGIERDFAALLEDPEAGYAALRDRLNHFDRGTLVQLLSQRQDLTPEESDRIVGQLESVRDRVLGEAQSAQDQMNTKAQELQNKLENYLRNTGKEELNPEGIKRELSLLLNDPQTGLIAFRNRASRFDRDTFVQLLSQREDFSEEEANQLADQMQAVWYNVVHAPQILAGKAKEQYEKTTSSIAEYLRSTNREELNPEGIKRDLSTLLNDPKEGTLALRRRLAQVDRETLVKLLSQREDLNEEQVNRIIDQVQDAILQVVKAPRRLAIRTQRRVSDFQSSIESYLRNTDKEELNPEGIKRDLQVLLNDPRAGVGSLSDRLSQFDRSTVVSLLAQRQDMTEEEANRIVDQVLSVREQVMLQIQRVQLRIQSVIDGIFARIRNYLNSLDRPELNYDSIKRDLRVAFDDPQAGFEALRARLGQFDRGTLVALMSSREDISEADANHIIDQIEGARNSVLQRAERLQLEAQRRVEAVKLQAQKQAEETRKAAASAAWWLFFTALVSAIASAGAGALAVVR